MAILAELLFQINNKPSSENSSVHIEKEEKDKHNNVGTTNSCAI